MTASLVAPTEAELRRLVPPLGPGNPRQPMASRDAAAAWHGVVWGRLGRGDHAFAWWDTVEDPALLPWIGAERGRVLRELGLHAEARAVETEALAAASDLVDIVMLRISLAADAVGLGQLERARYALGTVATLTGELPSGHRATRQLLRLRWVELEVQLLAGQRTKADGLPSRGSSGPTFPVAYDSGTTFHKAKGLLFAAIVREDPGLLADAARLAPPALLWAVELARLDAGDVDAGSRAVGAWSQVVPPPSHAEAVARTATAARLGAIS